MQKVKAFAILIAIAVLVFLAVVVLTASHRLSEKLKSNQATKPLEISSSSSNDGEILDTAAATSTATTTNAQ